jgi:hypothetical protein
MSPGEHLTDDQVDLLASQVALLDVGRHYQTFHWNKKSLPEAWIDRETLEKRFAAAGGTFLDWADDVHKWGSKANQFRAGLVDHLRLCQHWIDF